MDEGDFKYIRQKLSAAEAHECKNTFQQAKKALHDWKKSFNRIEPERSFSELAFGQEELGKGSRQKNKPRARGPKPSKKEKTEISSLAATEGEGEGTVKLDVTNPVEEPISQYNKDLGVENFEEKTE